MAKPIRIRLALAMLIAAALSFSPTKEVYAGVWSELIQLLTSLKPKPPPKVAPSAIESTAGIAPTGKHLLPNDTSSSGFNSAVAIPHVEAKQNEILDEAVKEVGKEGIEELAKQAGSDRKQEKRSQ